MFGNPSVLNFESLRATRCGGAALLPASRHCLVLTTRAALAQLDPDHAEGKQCTTF